MRTTTARRRHRGASLFEVSVCLAIFGVFMAVFLERSYFYQEAAEKTAMELQAEHIKASLRYRVADLILTNRMSEIPTLADENPMDWLDEKPANYLGTRDSAPETPIGGTWYFDRKNHELVYTVNNRRHFSPSAYRDFAVRYRVLLVKPVKATGRREDDQVWVTFAPVSEYRWFK